MLTKEEAVRIVQRTRDDYDNLRRAMDAFWTMAILYDTGKQWGFTTTNHGQSIIHQLRQVIDPGRGDVRVTMDLIHGKIKEMMAKTSPQAIAAFARPRTGSVSDTLVAGMGGEVLDNWLATHQGLAYLRETQRTRYVLGTSIIKRTIASRGAGRLIQHAAEDADKGKPLSIRDFDVRWTHAMPWEFIRDPAATSVNPERDEEVVIHEKPRTTAWVKRNYGITIESETKMGFLLSHNRAIHNAYGMGTGKYAHQSRVPAVMWYESYHKDPNSKGWDTMFVGYTDPQKDSRLIVPVESMPNPMFGLPLHFFVYDLAVQSPWGIGVPHIAMAHQDLTNLAWTWIMRIQQAGAGKIVYEKGTVERPEITLNSRIDQPIAWDRRMTNQQFGQAPTRLLPPQISPVTPQILSLTPQWMDQALNLSEVGRGVTSPRGESGKAVEQKLRAANAPLDQLRKDDDIIYQHLLYGTMADITNPKRFRLDIAKKMLGPDANEDVIRLMMRHPVVGAVKEIVIRPRAMHPKTSTELMDEAIELTSAQIIDGTDAEWAMIDREISKDKKQSKQKQELEIQAMISGRDVVPNIFDDHRYHIRQLRMFIDSQQWLSVSDKAKDRINEHAAGHFASLQQMELLLSVQEQTGPQGSPPATAFGQGAPAAAGSAGSAVGVA